LSQEENRIEARRWLLQARADLRAAEVSAAGSRWEWACFQAQQAGEKAVKAVWYHHSLDPWGHSIGRLIEDFPLEPAKARLLPLLQNGKELDKLYIPTRYPNGLPDMIPADAFTRAEAERAIAAAAEIIRLVQAQMEEASP
jgi:HEPN domain-containing protein